MKRLAPDDFRVGQYVTVMQPRVYEAYDGLDRQTGGMIVAEREDPFGMGDIFRVVAVDLPYVYLLRVMCKCLGKDPSAYWKTQGRKKYEMFRERPKPWHIAEHVLGEVSPKVTSMYGLKKASKK